VPAILRRPSGDVKAKAQLTIDGQKTLKEVEIK